MKQFLQMFVIEEGNGLSPFAEEIATHMELHDLIVQFFKPVRNDTRGNGNINVDHEADDDDSENLENFTETTVSPTLISSHVVDIQRIQRDNVDDDEDFIEAMAPTEQDGSISQEGGEVEELLVATLSSSDEYTCVE